MRKRANDTGAVPGWAQRLTAARTMTGDNQTAFAKKLGMSQQRYGAYETGKSEPSVDTWAKISALSGVSLDFIISGQSVNKNSATSSRAA